MIRTTLLALLLAGCGGHAPIDQPDQLLSNQPTVSCAASLECQQHGATAKTCSEVIHSGRAISTWDGGRIWLEGNCDSTAAPAAVTPLPGFGLCSTHAVRGPNGSITRHSIDGGHTWRDGACPGPQGA